MPEPTHEEAIEALTKIRQAVAFSDLAARIHFDLSMEAKKARRVAISAANHAIAEARSQTRPLPLFDDRDGVTPTKGKKGPKTPARSAPAPEPEPVKAPEPEPVKAPDFGSISIADLVLPEEVAAALEAFGFVSFDTILAFHKTGVDWTNVGGIDRAGAARLEAAINQVLLGQIPASSDSEGKAA